MGTNDHTPSKAQRTKRRGLHLQREVLVWRATYSEAMATLTEAVSEAGGYIGFGRNRSGDCLLVYIKLGDWNERVPIESYDDVLGTLADLLAEV